MGKKKTGAIGCPDKENKRTVKFRNFCQRLMRRAKQNNEAEVSEQYSLLNGMEDEPQISFLRPIEKNPGDVVRTRQPASLDLCGVCTQAIVARLVAWTRASWCS